MKYGFTGTRIGMTYEQKVTLDKLLASEKGEFIHGDCVGSDAYAHMLARYYHYDVTIHPANVAGKRAFCLGAKVVYEPAEPLSRNKVIARACDRLLAAPADKEELRSGTWSTIRYARRIKKPIIVILPDGYCWLQ